MTPGAARCRTAWAGTPLSGTAPLADAWWLVHLPRPWGAHALADSGLPGAADVEIARRTEPHGGVRRIIAVRRPREARGALPEAGLSVWVAGMLPDDPGLRVADGVSWAELAEWPGRFPPAERLRPAGPDAPWLCICTNGRRDPCCAEAGRALIDATAHLAGVWECSHLGGHRFAPTALDIASGYCLGRLDLAAVEQLRKGPGIPLPTARGRTSLSPAAQVADLHVRAELGSDLPDAVSVRHDTSAETKATGEPVVVIVEESATGRRWRVVLDDYVIGCDGISCGAAPEEIRGFRVVSTVEID